MMEKSRGEEREYTSVSGSERFLYGFSLRFSTFFFDFSAKTAVF
jgi:hypothetical protein